MLAPAPADQPLQWIDARDLAAFVLHAGVPTTSPRSFNVAVRPSACSLGEPIQTSSEAAGPSVEVAWRDPDFVAANEPPVSEERTRSRDPPDEPNAHLFDTSHAVPQRAHLPHPGGPGRATLSPGTARERCRP